VTKKSFHITYVLEENRPAYQNSGWMELEMHIVLVLASSTIVPVSLVSPYQCWYQVSPTPESLARASWHAGDELASANPVDAADLSTTEKKPQSLIKQLIAHSKLKSTADHWVLYASKVKKLKPNKALDENSSLSYGTSPDIWDHTMLPATRHKWTRPALTAASKLVLDLPTPEGWKAELN